MKRSTLRTLAAIALLSGTQLVHAQQPPYPTKPIRMLASQPPAGGIDVVCRIVSSKLAEALGQPVIVDNRPGANGSLAGELTAKAPPDGYLLMLGAVGNLGVNTIFYKKLGYDPLKDLAPVAAVVTGGNVLVVHPSVPAKSVKDLIALARARPGQLAYGTSGTGGSGHLAGALFRHLTKIEWLHVPYKGAAPMMVDIVAGQVQVGFPSPASVMTFIESGRLRPLAVTTAKRSKVFPQLPTIDEAGVPGYRSFSWYGFVVPARTPQYIIARLNKEIVQIVNMPDVAEALFRQGFDVWTTTPEAFGAHIKSEYDKWGRVIRAAGITEN